jgi:branched-chain amino acid transport system permease protein
MRRLRDGGRLLGVALVVLFVVLIPFGLEDYRLYQLGLVGTYAIALVGLVVVVGRGGMITVGHSALFAIGAYTTAILMAKASIPWPLAVVAGALLAAACGWLFAVPATRLRGHNLAIVTLALGLALPQVLNRFSGLTGGSTGLEAPQVGVPVSGVTKDQWLFWVVVAVVALGLWGARELLRGPIGRALVAARDHELAAASMGVPVARLRANAFATGALYAGLGGGAYVLIVGFVSPESFTITLAILMLTGVVVGGVEALAGAVLGAIFIEFVPVWISSVSQRVPPDVVYGVVLLALLTLAPAGLAGLLVTLARRARHPRGAAAVEGAPPPPPPPPPGLAPAAGPVAAAPAGAGGEALLRVEGLTVRHGGVTALDDVSLAVPTGAVCGVIGPNGAGKTTLFNTVTGLQAASGGRIVFDGRSILGRPAHELARLGMSRTFQELALFSSLTVRQNVLVGLHAGVRSWFVPTAVRTPRVRRDERALLERADWALEFVGLSADADASVDALDAERRKRLEIGRALAGRPRLLLLDEPAAGLERDELTRLAGLLRRIGQELGTTLLLVEHEMAFLMPLCSMVAVLDFGRVIATGTPDAVRRDSRVIDAYLGSGMVPA